MLSESSNLKERGRYDSKALETLATARLNGKYSPKQIRAALLGKTKEDIIALMGRPDSAGEIWEYDMFFEPTLLGWEGVKNDNVKHGFFVFDPLTKYYFKAVWLSFSDGKVNQVHILVSIRGVE